MQNTTLENSYVSKLRQILNTRYGKNLKIRTLTDLSENYNTTFFKKGSDLHIPIVVTGSVLGTAVIPSAQDLNEELSEDVAHLVKMVLEPALHKRHLEIKEYNLEKAIAAPQELPPIDIVDCEDSFFEPIEESNPSSESIPGNELNSKLIHLEGSSSTLNKKVALMLHDLTSRWAFVPFNDIKAQLHSAADIEKMGAMTIFVENIEALKISEQALLMDYIDGQDPNSGPLIITTCLLDLNDLAEHSLSSNFRSELQLNTFEVDRAPLTMKSLKEVLELFFLKETSFSN